LASSKFGRSLRISSIISFDAIHARGKTGFEAPEACRIHVWIFHHDDNDDDEAQAVAKSARAIEYAIKREQRSQSRRFSLSRDVA